MVLNGSSNDSIPGATLTQISERHVAASAGIQTVQKYKALKLHLMKKDPTVNQCQKSKFFLDPIGIMLLQAKI